MNEKQSSRADIKNSLFFGTSELFSPEIHSENPKSSSSRCIILSFETFIRERQFSEVNTKQSQKSMEGFTITHIHKNI